MEHEKMLSALKHILKQGRFDMKGEDALAFSIVYTWVEETLPKLINKQEKKKDKDVGTKPE